MTLLTDMGGCTSVAIPEVTETGDLKPYVSGDEIDHSITNVSIPYLHWKL